MEIVRNLDVKSWLDFVERHPHGNIFHTPEMFQVFERAKGHRPTLWATVEHNDHPLALLLPVQISLANGPLRQLTTRTVAYGSVLCAPGAEGQQALALLLRTYKHELKGHPLFTELRNPYDLSAVQAVLQDNDFAYEEHLNFLINLSLPVDQVWNNISKSARKKINKALKKDQLTIEQIHDPSQIAACYTIFQKTYTNASLPLADRSLFEATFDILHQKGMAKFLLGRVEDNYIAASVALLYKDVIYGWYRGFDRAYSTYLPNDLMVWHILKWGAEHGYRLFDFGGAGKPDEDYGPRKFKAKFGGALVNYGRNTCIHAPHRLKFSQTGYQLVRRFLYGVR